MTIALVLTLLLALLVPPYVNLKRFRSRLESSIGGALGRRVTIGSVGFRLLPRPGFDLGGFLVYDDPAFSAEPMLRADSVTASLRLTSLWRGRLEIASLSLRDVSLNVVRSADRHWNLESLLARASQVPSAPTARTHAEHRPRFPYIEAENGRINFKLGQEKTSFALVDAEFSLWLAQEDEWHLRLNARPVRTDFNLSDTGRIRASGMVRRAASFRDTPVDLRLTLERAQLGQLTTLIYRRDRGWRGAVSATAQLAGTPGNLQLVLDSTVDDFRRYDIITGGTYSLRARCTANYSVDGSLVSNLLCSLPAGNGQVTLRGQVVHPFTDRQFDLSLDARQIAVQELVRFAQHAKRDLSPDLSAEGSVDAAFTLQTRPQDPSRGDRWAGGGSTADLVLRSQTIGPALRLGAIRFALEPAATGASKQAPLLLPKPPLHLVFAPFAVALGARAPASASAVLSRTDYSLAVSGDADLTRLLDIAEALGIPAPQHPITGAAHLDLEIRGQWTGFGAPTPVGKLQLKNVALNLAAVNEPVRIASAQIWLTPDQAAISNLSASFQGTHSMIEGALQLPRRCDFGPQCTVRFDLKADQLNSDELNRLLNPQFRRRAWYQLFSGSAPSGLRNLHLEGHIAVAKLQIKSVTANKASADLELAGGRLELSNVRADLLGGKHQGRWLADFTGNVPSYSGTGSLDGVSLAQVSALMHDPWATGTAHVGYQTNLAGWTAPDLVQSLTAKIDYQWRDGVLKHIELRGVPLRFSQFAGHADLEDGKLTFVTSSMKAPSGTYQLGGSVSLARDLEIKLAPKSGTAMAIGGTLQKPHIITEPAAARAALKQ